MEHISLESLLDYIDIKEYNAESSELYEEISEHIMECDECASNYRSVLMAAQIAEDFNQKDIQTLFASEELLMEEYHIGTLFRSFNDDQLIKRLTTWLQERKTGIENSLKLYLCDEKHNKISGMIKNKVQEISALANMKAYSPIMVRGEDNSHRELSMILAAEDHADSRITLNSNAGSLMVRLEGKEQYLVKPPMVVLLPLSDNGEPCVQIAKERNGVYCIELNNLQPGEYNLYLEE